MRWRLLLRNPLAVAGLATLAALVLAALLAPWLSPFDPNDTNPRDFLQPPDATHPLGTDEVGRDYLSRLIYGARTSLTVSLLVQAITVLIGVLPAP